MPPLFESFLRHLVNGLMLQVLRNSPALCAACLPSSLDDVARVVGRSLILKSFNTAASAGNSHDFTFRLTAGIVSFHAVAHLEFMLSHNSHLHYAALCA
jgi:hypothetical protein